MYSAGWLTNEWLTFKNVMIIILKQSFIKVFTTSSLHQATRKMLLSD